MDLNENFIISGKFECIAEYTASEGKNKQAEYVALFPNVMLGIHKDHYYAFCLEPINHKKTAKDPKRYVLFFDNGFSFITNYME